MLAQQTDYESPVTLVMDGGVQFMDFALRLDLRRQMPGEFVRPGPNQPIARLVYDERSNSFYHPAAPGKAVGTEYSVALESSLKLFEGLWLPLPVFRTTPPRRFDAGPVNWARARLVALPEADVDGNTHVLTLAFDTRVLDARDDAVYLAPSEGDIRAGALFALAHQSDEMGWFLDLAWVDGWLREVFAEQAVLPPLRMQAEDIEEECQKLYHQAHYLNFLHVLGTSIALPEVKLASNQARDPTPIAVDLVLDVGNSRTCGILVEDHPQESDGLGKRYELCLRDLSAPDQVYQDPFESRVEFAQGIFGKDHFSVQSGRSDAFQWPTIARVGREAARLASRRRGTEGSTGLSSPKRYLWDEEDYEPGWRFNCAYVKTDTEPHATAAPVASLINEKGQALYRLPEDERMPVFHPHYSRSSLMSFMLCEVLAQALMQINSPAQRLRMSHSRVPRHLRSIILTVPPSMPKPEREIFAQCMEQAVGLVWKAKGWHEEEASVDLDDAASRAAATPPMPDVHVQWDEATCAQVVYLFNETQNHYAGRPEEFFAAMRRPDRARDRGLRIASIDIGGGTTDLVVTEYRMDGDDVNVDVSNVYIEPIQRFRDGFKIAGDDILLDVIDQFIVPAVKDAVRKAGVANPDALLSRLMGNEQVSAQESVLRQQLTLQVFVPLGLALLKAYEQYDPLDPAAQFAGTFGELLPGDAPTEDVLEHVATTVRRAPGGAQTRFDILAVPLAVPLRRVHEAFIIERMNIAKPLKALCEVLVQYHVDVVLLTGRPSRLPGVQSLLRRFLPLAPARILPLNHYHTGGWYPFHREGRIEDPKTTAAVGAMLCLLARNLRLPNFFFRSAAFRAYSTIKYLGQIDNHNLIKDANIYYRDIELDNDEYILPETPFDMRGTMRLGFRQLTSERWAAAPLYTLSIEDARLRERLVSEGLVLKIRLGVKRARRQGEGSSTFEIRGAESDQGGINAKGIRLRLNTLDDSRPGETHYWLDSGSIFHK